MFTAYDEILKSFRGEGDNYWSDVAVLEAIDKLNAFEEDDWDLLLKESNQRSNNWLIACAETLSESEYPDRAITSLLNIIQRGGDKELKIAVLDSINSILSYNPPLVNQYRTLIMDTINSLGELQGVVSIMISSLRKKLTVEY